jgi:hypothetical protein
MVQIFKAPLPGGVGGGLFNKRILIIYPPLAPPKRGTDITEF